MRPIRINYIVVLVVIAMLALFFIQAFQTRQLFDRKSAEFNSSFTTILDRIALQHEKAEDIRRYLNVVNQDFDVKYKDILKEEFKNLLSAKESITIEDTSIFENGKMESYLVIQGETFDSLSGVTAQQRVLARDVRQLRDLFKRKPQGNIPQDSIQLAVQLDQRVIQQIFKKARFVNEMMLDAFRSNIYEDPNKRIDIVFLDSVLQTEMANEKLPAEFDFLIVTEKMERVEFENAPKNYLEELDTTSSFKSLLFPSNSLDEDLYLYVRFPKQNQFLILDMWAPLTVNLALLIIIIVAMTMMFKTILTQKKLSELKSDFISNMTHEFKTPISTISLACEAMNDGDMGGNNAPSPYIKIINDENQRLMKLVERILQSATLDKGELKLSTEKINLNELIHEVVNTADLRMKKRNAKIRLELPDEFIYIQGDRFHLSNLLSNLIDNAIKYSDNEPEITVSLSKEGKKVHLSVSDKGIGIKKEHLSKIFDKLYRIPTGNVHNVKGFGLGLSYVKAIAELHGWNMVVRSKHGNGSTFTLEI